MQKILCNLGWGGAYSYLAPFFFSKDLIIPSLPPKYILQRVKGESLFCPKSLDLLPQKELQC